MKKILILGSKPEALVPADVDYVYASNASAYFYKDKISPFPKLVIVASAGVIYGADLSEQPKFYKITNSVRDELIVSGIDKIPGAQEKISEEVSCKQIRYYSAQARREIFYSIVGGNLVIPMLLACMHGKVEALWFLKYLWHLARAKFNNTDVPGAYRPSTGLFALAYAIGEHSKHSVYIVSGIGFERRGKYPDGSNVRHRKNPHHLIPDMLCFSELRKRYKILTTDPFVSKQFSIPLL